MTLVIVHLESLYNARRSVSIAEGSVVVVDTLIDDAQYDTLAGIGLGQSGSSGLGGFYNLVSLSLLTRHVVRWSQHFVSLNVADFLYLFQRLQT